MARASSCGVPALLASIVLALAGGTLASCTVPSSGHHVGDTGVSGDAGVLVNPNCDPDVDADADGLADDLENAVDITDADMDGTPNDHDTDSDGDGISDADEHGPYNACAARDSDHDGLPDYLDLDSDSDGVSDADEVGTANTNPLVADTDGDGFTDLAEIAASTDPTDPASRIPDTDFFVILPYQGDHVVKELDFGTDLRVADVYFLVDSTGSMGDPIDNIASSLSDIATQLAGTIPDVQFGAGHFEDFPFRSGSPLGATFYGSMTDVAYGHLVDIGPDLGAVEAALRSLYHTSGCDPTYYPSGTCAIGDGGDGNESGVEGLYQTATGEGGDWTFAPNGHTFSITRRECPAAPDEPGRRRGYPCFRPGSLPIVVMVTDYEWHNGYADGTHSPYQMISPDPHHLPDAAAALNDLGARFVGVPVPTTGSPPGSAAPRTWRMDFDAMATATGSVDGAGQPLVYPSDTFGNVGPRVVEAIQTLALHTPMDVTTSAEDWPPNPDMIDATRFIVSITAIEGYGPLAGEGYDHHDDSTFYAVVPGTRLRFDVDFHNDFRMPQRSAQIFRAKIAVIGNRSARLDERNVYIIVPPDNGYLVI